MSHITGGFNATDDGGVEHALYIFTDDIDVATMQDPNAVAEGMKELRTADGMRVNRLGKGVYKINATGVVLRCASPAAP